MTRPASAAHSPAGFCSTAPPNPGADPSAGSGAAPPIRLALSINHTAAALDVSRDTVELLIGMGELETIRVRSRRRVLYESLRRYVERGGAYRGTDTNGRGPESETSQIYRTGRTRRAATAGEAFNETAPVSAGA